MKSWLENNDIEMYSTNNEVKSVIAERLLERTLKSLEPSKIKLINT